MPFQSEKQRRYMHANLPDIANRWERDYAGGGRIGFDLGTNYKTRKELIEEADLDEGKTLLEFLSEKSNIGSDKYNIKLSPEAELSLLESSAGGYDIQDKNITYGVDTTANIGPVEIGMDYKKFLDKYDVTKEGKTVEKDTNRDRDIAYMLGLNLEDLYAKIDSDRDFKNFYFTIRKTFGGPKDMNQGGLIPSHEAGIYGLAEGGTPMLVAKRNDGQRPGYAWDPSGGAPQATESSPESVGGEGYQNVHQTGAVTQTPGRTTTTTTGDASIAEQIAAQDRQRKQDLKDIIARGDEEKYDTWEQQFQDKYPGTTKTNIAKNKALINNARNQWEQVKDSTDIYFKKKVGKKIIDQFLLGGATFGLSDVIGGILQGFKQSKAKQEFINIIKDSIKNYQDLGIPEYSPHTDTLIQTLNQELLDLTQTRDRPDGDGDGITGVASITYDKEDLRKKERASTRWRQEQKEVDRSKQMAYWRMMMAPYMSAQGGRVPAGYNTGGLSNLFKLKNR